MNPFILFATLASAVLLPAESYAAPMTYECDTPANKFSSIDVPIDSKNFTIRGAITPDGFSKGQFLPVANIHLSALDGTGGVWLRLVAPSAGSKQADVIVETKLKAKPMKKTIGKISLGESLIFSISVLPDSTIDMDVGGQQVKLKSDLAGPSKLSISCSTGEFNFANLEWSND